MGGECRMAGVAVATPTLPVPHQHFVLLSLLATPTLTCWLTILCFGHTNFGNHPPPMHTYIHEGLLIRPDNSQGLVTRSNIKHKWAYATAKYMSASDTDICASTVRGSTNTRQQNATAQIQVRDNNTRQHRYTKRKENRRYESKAAQWFGMNKRTGTSGSTYCSSGQWGQLVATFYTARYCSEEQQTSVDGGEGVLRSRAARPGTDNVLGLRGCRSPACGRRATARRSCRVSSSRSWQAEV